MFVKFLFALNGDRLSNWTYSTPMPKVEGDWDKSEGHNPDREICSNR